LVGKVYIANFGRRNYAWEDCKRRPSVATMNGEATHAYWLAGDKDGFIGKCREIAKTARGNTLPRFTAARWFNLMGIIQASSQDLWIHRAEGRLWWTETIDEPASIDEEPRRIEALNEFVFECHKPCKPWSDRDKLGRRITWDSLHPRAKDFLATESTLQALSPDNADFARALVEGADLAPWTSLPDWQRALANRKIAPVSNVSGRGKAALNMAMRAKGTAGQSNGQQATRRSKNKEFLFKDEFEAEKYIQALLVAQEFKCAITGLDLEFNERVADRAMLYSLDRIDSDKHYERGNLQVVCQFINMWKSDANDEEFRRLIDVVRLG